MSDSIILAVDDRKENLFVIEQIVNQYIPGAQLFTALSAKEGLEIANEHPVDIAILDVQMPIMDGIEMSRRLKENPKTKGISIVLLTAHLATSEFKSKGLEAGADDFISKPIDMVELTARIHVMLRIKENEKALRDRKEILEATVTERTLSLARANRALKMHSDCNKAIVHTRSEKELLVLICDIVAKTGHYPMCRVDYLNIEELLSEKCMALISNLDIQPYNETPGCEAPSKFHQLCSQVAATGQHQTFRNIQTNSDNDTIKAEAAHYKYKSLIILPIVTDRGIVGTLSVGSPGLNAFGDDETELLSEIVTDLGFGIQTLRLYKQQAKTESSLQESRETMRALLNSPPDFAFLLELDGTILSLNDNAAKAFKRVPEELIGEDIFDLLPESISDRRRKKMDIAVQLGKPMQYEDRTLKRRFAHSLFPIYNDQGILYRLSVFSRDITREKQLENESKRLTVAIEHSPESIIITDKKGVIQYVNPGFETNTGYTRKEAVGQNPRFLQSGKHKRTFYQDMWRTLSQGNIWKGELINRRKNGSLFEEGASIAPVKDDFGNVIHYVAVKLDMTEQKKMERQLRQGQKMEAIGTLAGGIAHDFNNILSSIMGYTELTIHMLPPDSTEHKFLSSVLGATKRAANLVNQILMFSRKKDTEMKPLQLKSIVKETVGLLRASLPATIEIKPLIYSNAFIQGDATQIHQVVMNLGTNSGYAMKDSGGVLTIKLMDIDPPDSDTDNRLIGTSDDKESDEPLSWVQLSVIDTGIGIEKEHLKRLFDPFFTTKATGEGTGMGLSVVHGIVESHDAIIQVMSDIGKGTEVKVMFPVTKQSVPSSIDTLLPYATGSENILLVDDEHHIIEVHTRSLTALGYSVTAKTSPEEALKLFKDSPNDYDMVITDLTMPNMTGDILAERILAVKPDIPILLCTGFCTLETEKRAEEIGVSRIINKPLTLSQLSEAVRSVFNEKSR